MFIYIWFIVSKNFNKRFQQPQSTLRLFTGRCIISTSDDLSRFNVLSDVAVGAKKSLTGIHVSIS